MPRPGTAGVSGGGREAATRGSDDPGKPYQVRQSSCRTATPVQPGVPQHGGVAARALIDDAQRPPGRSTRTASRSACARPEASRMLLIARLLTTTSNDAAANGRSRASASTSSTRPATPSATALRSAAARLLPLWSRRRHTSAPTARPAGSRRAASISTAPRPHPTSSRCSSPRRPSSSSSCAQIARLPGPVEYR